PRPGRHDFFRLAAAARRFGASAAWGLPLCRPGHHHDQRDPGRYRFQCAAGRLHGILAFLSVVSRRVFPSAQAYRTLRCRAGGQAAGARMIDSLAAALGLGAHDPSFWMPLVFMALFFAIIVAGAILDGFDVGVGCLALFAPPELRMRMLSLLSP